MYFPSSKLVFILAIGFYVYIEIDDIKSRHIYKTNTSNII